jgi:hypothetical protein
MAHVAVAPVVRMEASELPASTEWQAEDEIPHAKHWYGPLAKESCNRVKGNQGGAGSHVHLKIFSRSCAPYKYNFVGKYDLPCGQTIYKYRRATTSQIILIREIRGTLSVSVGCTSTTSGMTKIVASFLSGRRIYATEIHAEDHIRACDVRVRVQKAVIDANIATSQTQILLFDADAGNEKPFHGNVVLKAREVSKAGCKSSYAHDKNVRKLNRRRPRHCV